MSERLTAESLPERLRYYASVFVIAEEAAVEIERIREELKAAREEKAYKYAEDFALTADDLHRIINECGSANDLSDVTKDLLLAHYILDGEPTYKIRQDQAQRIDDLEAQLETAREALRNAPHSYGFGCDLRTTGDAKCLCWKADALAKIEGSSVAVDDSNCICYKDSNGTRKCPVHRRTL